LNAWLDRTISGEHATNATRWIGNVARIPRNEMNMDVHARLTRSATNIHSNVVTVRRILRLYKFTGTVEQFDHRNLLKVRHFEEVRNMPPWYDNDMAAAQRILLRLCVRQSIFEQDRPRQAKLTVLRISHRSVFRAA